MSNILVTGGAGFIGSNLVDRLVWLGHDVIVVDNLSTGKRENLNPAVEFVQANICHYSALVAPFNGKKIDVIYHIAGTASIPNSITNPYNAYQTNVQGTINVVRLARELGVKKFIYASSMTVYGNIVAPFKVGDNCKPCSDYGMSKYAAERHIINALKGTDTQYTCFRLFNVYGPRQDLDNPYQGVVAIFLGKVLAGKEFTVYGDGEQTRDFSYIDDVVEYFIGAMNNPIAAGRVLNVGTGSPISINNIARYITGPEGTWVTGMGRSGEQRHCHADMTETRDIFQWAMEQNQTPIDVGLKKTYEWAEKRSY